MEQFNSGVEQFNSGVEQFNSGRVGVGGGQPGNGESKFKQRLLIKKVLQRSLVTSSDSDFWDRLWDLPI